MIAQKDFSRSNEKCTQHDQNESKSKQQIKPRKFYHPDFLGVT